MTEPDWALWRSFAAVVAEGSLSAAARKLHLSQPTLGRHVETLEQALGIALFERTLKGLQPTDAALQLYEPVLTARNALAEAQNRAEGQNAEPGGTVRLTSSMVFSHYILPDMLKTLRAEYPAIALELVPSDSAENLLLREADIAIRLFRPTQLDLITRHIGDVPLTTCAHQSYLAERGTPRTIDDLYRHDLIGFDRSDLILKVAQSLGFTLERSDFIIRSDNQTLLWQLVTAGLGVGFAQASMVDDTPGMLRLLPELKLPPLEIWLTTHRELFTSRRIRAIYDRLADLLTHHVSRIDRGA